MYHFSQTTEKVGLLQLNIENTSVDIVGDFTFLRLIINEYLNWKSHIDKLPNKISKTTGVPNKLEYFAPLNARVIIYNSLILSHLNYCSLARGYICERITKLQKHIVRILSLSKYNTHKEPIFKTLKLLKLIDIQNLQELKFYYKNENNLLPYYLQNLPFQLNANSHATRSHHKICQLRPMHEYVKKCIQYSIPNTINYTAPNIVDNIYTHSMQGFSGYIKQSLLYSYQEHCTISNCYICSRS